MIEIGGGDTQTYVLPLENIDLTYLSKYVRSSRGSVPLWSKKQLDGEVQYFEIKIPTQEYNEDDCYYEPSDTYKCHICNTDVPTMFFKEHIESVKHNKNKNIFEKVLERVSKHINLNVDSNCKDNNQDVYYCVPCSKTVKRKNKFKHEATEYHTNSLKNIQILNDFHDMFVEINNNDNQNAIEDEIMEKEYICNTPSPIVPIPNNLDSDIENNNFDDFNDNLTHAYKNSNKITIKPDLNSAEKDEVSFESYLENVKSKYNIRINLPKVEGKYVYIMNPKGVKVKIPQAHYQGYKYIANKTYCILCNHWMEDITAHNEMESHVRNMLKPVDGNFTREVNSMTSNCLVCNQLTLSNSDHHWNSDKHTKALKDTKVIQTIQYNDVTKVNKTLCDICNVYIDTHNILEHKNSENHNNLNEKLTLEQNKITKINANEYLCGVCNVQIQIQHPNCLSDHINSSAHVASKNSDFKNPEYYCNVCQVKVTKGDIEIHEKGKTHTKKLAEKEANKNNVQNENSHQSSPSVANSYSTASTSTNSVCGTESISAITEKDSFEAYLKYVKAKYNLSVDLPTVEGEYVYIVNPKKVKIKVPKAHFHSYRYCVNITYCVLCGKFVNDTTVHDEEESHVRNILKPVGENFARAVSIVTSHCLVCNESIMPKFDGHWLKNEHIKALHDSKVTNNNSQNSDVTKVNKTQCDVCDVNIDTHNFLEHTNSEKHNNLNEKLTLEQNKITKINANEYLCGVCNVQIQIQHPNCLSDHINSSAHVASKNSDFKNPEYYCNVCQVKVTKGDIEIHEKGKTHTKKLAEKEANKNNVQNENSHQSSPSVANSYSIASTSTNSVCGTASISAITEKDSFEAYLKNVKAKYNLSVDLPTVEGEYVYIVNPQKVKIKVPQAHFQSYRYIVNKTYCILCGKFLKDITVHDEEESHVKNILKPVDENFAKAVSTLTRHCLVCNELIMSKFDDHWISDKHVIALHNSKDTYNNSQNSDVTKVNKTLCEICNVHIDTHNFLGHTNSKKHKRNKEKLTLEQNKITKINENEYLCGVCNVQIQIQNPNCLSDHINSSAHVASKNPDFKNSEYYCTVCQVEVPKGGMEIHEKGKTHTKKLAEKEANKNNVQNENSHQSSSSVTSSSTSTNSVCSTTSNSTLAEFEYKVKSYYKLLLHSNVGGKTVVECRICKIQIPYVRRDIILHMEGWLHTHKVKILRRI